MVDPHTGKVSYPDICPEHAASEELGDIPVNFSTVGNQPQFSWVRCNWLPQRHFESASDCQFTSFQAEGNDLKIFGCEGHCDGTNCNSTAPGYTNKGYVVKVQFRTAHLERHADFYLRTVTPTLTNEMFKIFEFLVF